MAITQEVVYDESKIVTLSSLEHIRLRPGMYIGRLGNGSHPNDGIYILLKEVIDNSIDEFIMGHGRHIEIRIDGGEVFVRDYGRGIPQGKLVDCVSVINTGAKYNDDVFQFSVGLNGVGTKAVNALSSYFRVVSVRGKRYSEALFSRGKMVSQKQGKTSEQDGTYVEFEPDTELFGEYEFDPEYVERRLWNYAYLNSGLTLKFGSKRFLSKNGLRDLLYAEVGDDTIYGIAYQKAKLLEFSFTHTNTFGENYFSFVNGQFTSDGGTHRARSVGGAPCSSGSGTCPSDRYSEKRRAESRSAAQASKATKARPAGSGTRVPRTNQASTPARRSAVPRGAA